MKGWEVIMKSQTYRDLFSGYSARVDVKQLQPRGLEFTAHVHTPAGVTFTGEPARSTVQALVNSGLDRATAVAITARGGYR